MSTLYLSLATQAETTILAVIGQGVGLGLLAPSGNALISDAVSCRGAGFVFLIYQISTLSAAIVGAFGAGALATSLGFPTMFLLTAVLTGFTAVFGYLTVPETMTRKAGGYASVVSVSLQSSIVGTVRMLRSNRELALLTGALAIHSIAFATINSFIPLYAEKGHSP